MVNELPATLDQLRAEFRRFPAPVVEEFDKARAKMPKTMEEGSILLWGQAGLGIANQTVRSWEAASSTSRSALKSSRTCRSTTL